MGRRRTDDASVPLPRGVHRVCSRGRIYYYWQPGRGTGSSAGRERIHGDPFAPPSSPDYIRFHRELAALTAAEAAAPRGSVAELVDLYRASSDYLSLAVATRASYDVSLNRFARADGWGHLPANRLTPPAVLAGRDALKATPVMANQMLSVGSILWSWAIPLGLITASRAGAAVANPFGDVKPLRVEDRGHVPWPAWVVDYVTAHASPDIVRMMKLGLMTCQRESDLIRMGPQHRQDGGIWCRPKKTRTRRRAFRIPLRTVDAILLDRWAETPIAFTAARWKAPIERHREDLYLYSPKGAPYTPTSLRARWHRWLATASGAELCRLWRAYLARQVERYAWDIDPEDAVGPTIHGLRGAGILLRRAEGYEVADIANDIGMSRIMVEHYMRFRDQIDVSAGARARLEIVSQGG